MGLGALSIGAESLGSMYGQGQQRRAGAEAGAGA